VTLLIAAVVLVLLALLTVLVGLPFLALALFVVAVAAAILGAIGLSREGGTRAPTGHRTRKPTLLGPGGPDDPES
jgi:hypothetical protein